MSSAAKAKLSITLAEDVAREVDRAVAEKRWPSRSAAIEAAVKVWAVRERSLRRDAAIEEYYRHQGAAELSSDREWAEAAWSGFVEIAKREKAAHPKRRARARRRRRP